MTQAIISTAGEGFTNPFFSGFWGLIFSPYRRRLLAHAPLYRQLIGFVAFLRRHRLEAAAIGVLSVVLIVLYSLWWMWWGGFAWGPRFLVPLTPLWVLLILPPGPEVRQRDHAPAWAQLVASAWAGTA